jgi:hypothetical protein
MVIKTINLFNKKINFFVIAFCLVSSSFLISCKKTNVIHNKPFLIDSKNILSGSEILDIYLSSKNDRNIFNISPEISWYNPPRNTKSFAFTIEDVDGEDGKDKWHWVLIDIPFEYNNLKTNFYNGDKFNITNDIKQIKNDFGFYKYYGPHKKPDGKVHKYIFTIYALNKKTLELKQETSSLALVMFAINNNTIAKSSFVAFY